MSITGNGFGTGHIFCNCGCTAASADDQGCKLGIPHHPQALDIIIPYYAMSAYQRISGHAATRCTVDLHPIAMSGCHSQVAIRYELGSMRVGSGTAIDSPYFRPFGACSSVLYNGSQLPPHGYHYFTT